MRNDRSWAVADIAITRIDVPPGRKTDIGGKIELPLVTPIPQSAAAFVAIPGIRQPSLFRDAHAEPQDLHTLCRHSSTPTRYASRSA